jgi:hypothetical protein
MTLKPLRRLVDLPGMAELERQALMRPSFADDDARLHFPEIDACSMSLFGLTADEAEAAPRPEGWDDIERRPIAEQVFAFEDAGWDVTDKRRPLRMLAHFNQQLWLAIRDVAGHLPFQPEDTKPEGWVTSLTREAERFRKR